MTIEITSENPVVSSEARDGFSFLDNVFIESPHVIDSVVVEPAEPGVEPTPTRRSWKERIKSAFQAAKASLACVREAVTWLFSGVTRSTRKRVYVGRHHLTKPVGHRVRTTLLGRDRSTSEYSRIVQRRCRDAADSEGELAFQRGDTFVGWVTAALESMQHLEYARRHDPHHGRWICS